MISLFPERGAPVLFEAELDSTNTRLKAMAAYAEPGTVIAAGRQTGGRGRRGRSFSSPSGGVYLSMLLAPAADMRACLTLTPTAAVAVRRALKKVCGLGADIKWPNDLQFGGKKLCGILTESVTAGGSFKLIIGIGVNLNTGMDELPLELHDTACSVYSVTGRYTPQEAVIRAIVDELDSAYAHWVVNSHWALDDCRAACASLGHRVQRGSVCGEAVAIADDFSLLIRTDAGEFIRVSSGEILYA